MSDAYLAIINPAAGGGRCGKLAPAALDRLRDAGMKIEAVEVQRPGQGSELAREGERRGFQKFLAVGGDGTTYEIVNGLFPRAPGLPPPTLAFLPLGTGNSFVREFSARVLEHAMDALQAGRRRPCDVLRLTHRDGVIHYINLLSLGFAADVAVLRDRQLKRLGTLGYWLGALACLARLNRRAFPLRADDDPEFDRRRCLFLSFNNSSYTGGHMMIAPQADPADGLIEYVHWGPIGRLGLLANLRRLYDGSHIQHPLAERRGVKQVEFALNDAVDMMVDGEVMTLHPLRLDVLPGALTVVA
ncbi:MAG TPA: YegS/Rv2252/BmrU family lipid kinase [Candidatus Acidoferrales bacterium]|nr:YegS/Rv2252/BmrU family lipid kinase [Candidatus Acidoferrales bacterium]